MLLLHKQRKFMLIKKYLIKKYFKRKNSNNITERRTV